MAGKPRKTAAFKVFEANIERSRAFLRIFDKDRVQGRPSNDEMELLRGCAVFAVGALDAYLSDLILEIVPSFGPRSASLSEALTQIARQDPGLALRVSLAGSPSGRGPQEEFREALSRWLDNKSFHGPRQVTNALGYVGCAISWPDFDSVTGVNSAAELERITIERHSIVHRGETPYVRRQLAEQTVALISSMAEYIDRQVLGLYY